jgi:Ca-activated chloride channel family protein
MRIRVLAGAFALAVVAPASYWVAAAATVETTDPSATVEGTTVIAEAPITFEGVVRDSRTGRPIAGVQVFLTGTTHGMLTDGAGRYTIEVDDDALVGASVTLRARLIGYQEAEKTVRVVGPTVRADFLLDQARVELQDVIVSGEDRERPAPAAATEVTQKTAGVMMQNAQAFARRSISGLPGRYNPNFHTESYARIEENEWLAAAINPLSTFSIDVDRASYSNIRRFIQNGDRPPIDAVRIEEMINYFAYDYPQARGDHPFTVATEVTGAPWNPRHHLVRIGVQGRRVDLEELPPSNLVFLLDVSGSMQPANKLPLLKKSLRMLVNELRRDDRVAIVVYAGAAGLVLPSTAGSRKEEILDAIENLEAGGSTAGGAGLRLAYKVAAENHIRGGNNRVILATDGDFNIGASSDAEMTRLIEEKREQGTFLTVLGFGMGNLKDSKMEAIADHGNGNYAYIDHLLEARKVLVTEMGGTLLTIAKDVKIQVEFNPARVQAYRLIGYENRLLAAEDFNDDTKDAGELGAGHSVTALYEVVPVGAPPVETGSVDPLRYSQPSGLEGDREASVDFGESSDELMFVKLRYKAPDGERSRLIEHPVRERVVEASIDLRFAASVAAFGMLLRESEHCRDFTLRDVLRLARGALGDDEHGYRAEFVRLVSAAQELELLETETY